MEDKKDRKPGGKKPGQKFKSLLVWDILQKRTDENHAIGIKEIRDYLLTYGIEAERHSISRDINDLMELLNRGQDGEPDDRSFFDYEIEYDAAQRGYKLCRRPYDFEELRLLAECVRASKFISRGQEADLLNAIEGMCSEYQVEELHNEVYLVGRTKTPNKHIMRTLLTINQAIRENKKITFKYQRYSLQDRTQQVDRRNGAAYVLSPFKLIINDGNYYLLAFDSKVQSMKTFRLDRMRGVELLKDPREGELVFSKINIRTYTQRVFSMFGGEPKRVSLRFSNVLLDAVVERFGTGTEVFYRPDGDSYFVVSTDVEISDQFYGWLCGYRKLVQIVSPPDVIANFQKFLDDIYEEYQSE